MAQLLMRQPFTLWYKKREKKEEGYQEGGDYHAA
jgi:hypothetical protein